MRVMLWLALALGVFTLSLAAQEPDWQHATDLKGIDLESLNPFQRQVALQILRDEPCSCGCNMKIAECRLKDPACSYSLSLASKVVKWLKEGQSSNDVRNELLKLPHRKPNQVLEDPLQITLGNSPARGPANAKLTIVEFSDFQCPYCSVAVGQAYQVLKMFPNDVRLVFKQFPLDELHPMARLSAEAALAANAQGKFWEMHDKLFANARKLTRDNIYGWAREIGLDMTKFEADMSSGKFKQAVQNDFAEGMNLGVQGTPTFFLNGRRYNGPFEVDVVKPLIEAELKGGPAAKQQASAK